jgi:hypothetical protein
MANELILIVEDDPKNLKLVRDTLQVKRYQPHVSQKERAMTFLRSLGLSVILVVVAAGFVSAQDCSGTVTADEAMKAEAARYAAQTKNDLAAMEKMFGSYLTYNHSSAATDNKATYIDSMRSGRVKYREMKPNSDTKTRTYSCVAIITGTAVYEVTVSGENRTVPLRYTVVWVKRPGGLEFVSWQSTGIPPR